MSVLLAEWRADAKRKILLARPEMSEKKIEKYLDEVIEKRFKNPECFLDNNYRKKTVRSNLAAIYDWIGATKPIVGGYGVFYKNQNQAINLITKMTRKFLDTRSAIKTRMKGFLEELGPDSYEYKRDNRFQSTEKICGNSIYGCSGAKISFAYNRYTAPSTTATAQSLISTACAAFEGFLAGNTKFYDTDEIISYIDNITREEFLLDVDAVIPRTVEETTDLLCNRAFEPKKINVQLIRDILSNLTSAMVARIYYKSNLYEFIQSCEKVQKRIYKFMHENESFRAPEKKYMKGDMEKDLNFIWKYLSEFVHYKHPIYNRIFRLKTAKRKSVLVIDTDSNMLHIEPWINMILTKYANKENDAEENLYMATSMFGVFITNMVQDSLDQSSEIANLLPEYWSKINMKNEFFFEKLITMEVKKNYMSTVLLREGKPMKGKLDIKGLSFVKSTTSKEIGDILKDIVKTEIMGKKINFSNIISRLDKLSEDIRSSLLNGKGIYAKPMIVQDMEHYKDGMKEMGVRAALVHNLTIPDDPIELPDYLTVFKVKMKKESDIECIKEKYPQIYELIMEKVFRNPNVKISKGFNAFAVKQDDDAPEWLIPLIDTDTIVEDNLKSFFPVLKSLGFDIINNRSDELMYSNIINL